MKNIYYIYKHNSMDKDYGINHYENIGKHESRIIKFKDFNYYKFENYINNFLDETNTPS